MATAAIAIPETPLAPPTASIHAGDLDVPGFPRDLPGRVALLTGLVMVADLLLPWVSVNGEGYAPTWLGLPALALALVMAVVVAPPLIPRLRRAPLTRMLPFGVGALTLGFASALWLAAGPLAPTLTAALAARLANAGAPDLTIVSGSASGSGGLLQIAPAIGLYLFIIGACVLLVVGYQLLKAQSERA